MKKKRSSENCLPHKPLDPTPPDIERFWSKVNIKSDEEWWNWKAFKNKQGYGRFGHSASKCVNAHRMSWVIKNGQIPDKMFVCHRCDNPSCVNPNHLFLGTRQDNINDMMIKKRGRHFGEYGFYGVRYEERYDGNNRKGRWRSFICKNEKIIYINSHTSALEAARNYDRIAYIVFGERERLNFPEEYDIKQWN